MNKSPIGVFDSGIGGLTILNDLRMHLPEYDYIYLGDNARAPYGNHDFDTVFEYTWQCLQYLFQQGCPLVILACNTASAKALRTIQQKMLPVYYPDRRVLGVIRPTAEVIGMYSKSKKIGVFGTVGTVKSGSYVLEIKKYFPEIEVFQQACPMWVPIIENHEQNTPGADYFIQKYIQQLLEKSVQIDAILLGCTHYPLMYAQIKGKLPKNVALLVQGEIVAKSLKKYLISHPEMDEKLLKNSTLQFYTTGNLSVFDKYIHNILGIEEKSSLVKLFS